MTVTSRLDVLVPTCGRPAALAATLAGLVGQAVPVRLVVADQTPDLPAYDRPEVAALLRVLRHTGCAVEVHHRPERRGVAEQRAFLLDRARAPYCLFLDDDILLEPDALAGLVDALGELRCGFVGMPVTGLSHVADVRPHEHAAFELWEGSVIPERVRKDTPAWERWRLHNAANPVHLASGVPVPARGWVAYKVAWVTGCVLYRTAALRAVGGFDFWCRLPADAAGEDVVAQLRVMERYGGAGLLPSRAHHLELATTLPSRRVDAYAEVLERDDAAGRPG